MSYQNKRIIGAEGEINHLAPFKYPWAWDMCLKSLSNHWIPQSIGMGEDRFCHDYTLSTAEKELFTNVFAKLTTSDVVIGRNVAVSIMQHITAPEVSAYLARQIAEEMLHSMSYQHCIEVLGLDQDDIYTRYEHIPEMREQFELAKKYAAYFDSGDKKDLMRGLIFFYLCFEGIWFYNGFTPIFSLQRRNMMTGSSEQLQYIMRDESMHIAFGIKLIRGIIEENPEAELTTAEVQSIIREALAAEQAYAERCIPRVLGYSPELHMQQARYIADRRLKQLGIMTMYSIVDAPVPWLDEQINIRKEKNFFETHVNEYQQTKLEW